MAKQSKLSLLIALGISDKLCSQVAATQEKDHLKKEKEKKQEERKKKKAQKEAREAGEPGASDDELEELPDAMVKLQLFNDV